MEFTYKSDITPAADQIIALYDAAALPRPTKDKDRIAKMYANSDIVITAWDEEKLVGVCRSVTDWVWSCYLADLAVDPIYKKSGIGRRLVELTKEKLGEQSMILLLSVPDAMDYYPKLGFTKDNRAFMINRTK